jgi:osmotically-inducible protein OsmY
MKFHSRTAYFAALPLALALGACSPDNTANTASNTAGNTANNTADTTAGQKLDNAVANTKTELARAGDEMREKSAEAGKGMDDAAITASIKTDILKDPELSVLKIDVDTKDGVVTLNGLADTAAAKTRAEQLANNIKGVKEVHNYLAVKRA